MLAKSSRLLTGLVVGIAVLIGVKLGFVTWEAVLTALIAMFVYWKLED